MKTSLKTITALLLLFNGAGAIYGGGNLIVHPDGSSIQLSLGWLEHTPFSNYLIPGIVLVLVNGVMSIFALAMLLTHHRDYEWWVMGQGIVLLAWLVIQMVLIRHVDPMHVIMGAVGVLLMAFGWMELNIEHPNEPVQ